MNAFEQISSSEHWSREQATPPKAEQAPDPEQFRRLFEATVAELSETYQAGTLAFISEHDPSLFARTQQSREELSRTWIAGDLDAFKEVLTEFRTCIMKQTELFNIRSH